MLRKYGLKLFVVISFIFVVCTSDSYAQQEGRPGLLVTPTRIVLEGRNRSTSVSLANNGNATAKYKVDLVEKRMNEDGSIVDVDKPMAGELSAKDIIRISPRRFTMEPNGHQNIRILVRKPENLPAGEYRSHLNIAIVPDEDPQEAKKQTGEESLSILIKANFGVTIPVIIRHGDLSASGKINNISMVKEEGKQYAVFSVLREGNKSLYGDINIKYTNTEGKEFILKSLGGIAVYAPNKKRDFKILLDIPEGVKIGKGKIEVSYKEKEKEGDKVIATMALSI